MIGTYLKLILTYGPGAISLIHQAVKAIKDISCPEDRKLAVKAAVAAKDGPSHELWQSQAPSEIKKRKRAKLQAFVKTLQDKSDSVA